MPKALPGVNSTPVCFSNRRQNSCDGRSKAYFSNVTVPACGLVYDNEGSPCIQASSVARFWRTMPRLRAQMAAAQIAGTLRTLTGANLIRQVAGLSADATAAQSHAETTAAFELLESGLGTLFG